MPAGEMDANSYTVGINNRFIGMESDMNDDPWELIRVAQEKPSKKEAKPKGKKEVKPATKGFKEKSNKAESTPTTVTSDVKKSDVSSSDRQRGRGRGGSRGRGGDRGRGGGRRGGFGSSDSPREETSTGGFGDAPGGGSRPSGGSKGACHKCHEEGHFARECPNVESTPRSSACHKCGEEGHFARQCPKSGPPGGGACHKCNEVGHFARECPQNNQSVSSDAPSSGGGFGGSSGGFGAPSSGGFGAPASGGFGAPASGGFGAPASGGFGAPSSGGFGAPSSGGFGGNEDDGERRGGRAGFRGRGGRGGRGRGRGGGREFDRRSGSDKSSVKASDKRDGAGSYNWGTPQDELEASEEQQTGFGGGFGAPKEGEDAAADITENNQETGTESGEENKENNVQEITFEEWKNQQQEMRSKPQHNLRRANEGEKIKGVKQLKKPTEEENESDGSLFFPKKYYEEKLKTSGRVKESVSVDFKFKSGDNRHYDTDRGRRGGRGGRGGRVGRKDNDFGSSTKQYQLENTEEFPSL